MAFTGFPADAQAFLAELAHNNTKGWFDSHRARYEAGVLAPMRALVDVLGPTMLAVDPQIEVRPAVGKTLSRPNRDIRFAKDKSPYRTTAWLVFRRPGKLWPKAPAFFFEIDGDGWRYGMGYYSAAPATMFAMRQAIDADPKAFARAIAKVAGLFDLGGETYKRPVACAHNRDIQAWYQRKNVYIIRNCTSAATLQGGGLPEELARTFTAAADLYGFLTRLGETG